MCIPMDRYFSELVHVYVKSSEGWSNTNRHHHHRIKNLTETRSRYDIGEV